MQQILRLVDIQRITALSRSSIYRLVSKGEFPRQIKLGHRSCGWLKSEIDDWLEEKIEASRKRRI